MRLVAGSRGIFSKFRAFPNDLRPVIASSPCYGFSHPKISLARSVSTQDSTRNIGIIAHIDAGKTTTTERMLYFSGVTQRLGNVDRGDTVTDFLPAERERGITIQSAAITLGWQGTNINLIDTPGHADFTFEVVRSLRVLDGAVTILDGVAGVEAQTEKVWSQAAELGIPRIIFVNKMDRPGAGFSRTVREVVSKLKTHVAMLNIPYFEDNEFRGVIDVLDQKLLVWDKTSDGKEVTVTDASEMEEAQNARIALVETLAEVNEDVVEEFLEVGDHALVSRETLVRALRKATLENVVCPVLCGASFRNIGVQPLLDAVVEYLPSPEERPPATILNGAPLDPKNKTVRALAFKVVHDNIRGTLVYVRVYSGTLKKGSVVFNTTTKTKERATKLLRMQADEQVDIEEIATGGIGVIVGSKEINTGDTLVAHATKKDGVSSLSATEKDTKLLPITVPSPVFVSRITPKTVSDIRSMNQALEVLLREDPSLHLTYDDEVGQWLLSGMGELHLEIARDRLINTLKANVEVGDIMITYKETLQAPTEEVSLQRAGDIGQVAVAVRIDPIFEAEPLQGTISLPDENEISLNVRKHPVLSRDEIQRAVQIGVKPVIAKGGKLGRMALRSLRFMVSLNISMDTVSTELIAPLVREAAQAAIQNCHDSNFSLLEPVMKVVISVPQDDVGAIMMDVSGTRRGHVIGVGDTEASSGDKFKELAQEMYAPLDHTMYMSKHEQEQTRASQVQASVPLRKMIGYLSSLRSMTQGRGTFQMEFEKFEPVALQDVEDVLS